MTDGDFMLTYMSAVVLISIMAIVVGLIVWGAVAVQLLAWMIAGVFKILSSKKIWPQLALIFVVTAVVWIWKQKLFDRSDVRMVFEMALGIVIFFIPAVLFVAGIVIQIVKYIINKYKNRR